jgi:hypothetical protein
MGKLQRLLTVLILPTALVGLFSAFAMADNGSTGATSVAGLPMPSLSAWSSLIMLACAATLWALRNYTHDEAWTHTAWWGLVSSLLSGVATALPPAIQTRGLSAQTLHAVIFGVFTAALAQSKPVGKSSDGGGGPAMILPFLLLGALGASGCAHGADGLRQACTATDTVLATAYQTTAKIYHVRKEALKAQIPTAGPAGVKQQWDLAHEVVDKVLAGLDAVSDTKTAVCALIPAVEAGQRKDVASLVAQLTALGPTVAALVADVEKLRGEIGRRVAWRLSPRREPLWRWA